MKITTLLLKQAAAKGLTLAKIGQILCRPDDDETVPSLLEDIVKKAELCANLRALQQKKFKDSMIRLIDEPQGRNVRMRNKPPALRSRMSNLCIQRPRNLTKNNSFSG